MSKNVFELLQEAKQFKEEVYPFIIEAYEHHGQSATEIINMSYKISTKLLTYAANTDTYKKRMAQIKKDKPEHFQELQDMFLDIEIKDHFSKWNTIIWVKRAYRQYIQFKKESYVISEIASDYLSDLKELINDLKLHRDLSTVFSEIRQLNDYRDDLLKIKSFELEFFTPFNVIEAALSHEKVIDVNDLLGVISVAKDKETQRLIRDLPEQIEVKDLMKLMFIECIEDEDDQYMNRLIMQDILKFRKENPEAARKMDSKLGLDMIPTYSVKFDAFGEVADIQRNKPNLKLV